MKLDEFISPQERTILVNAIKEAEKMTSGEIRVHIEPNCGKNVIARAIKVFKKLKMNKTALRNGVLIYVAYESKQFSIIGDKGINEVVPEDFWNSISEKIHHSFSSGNIVEGFEIAIKEAGKKLSEFFPYSEYDINEQSDEISIG